MKKLFVLMVLVVAMVAAPLFAEITEDGWAGDFRYRIGGDFTNPAVDQTLNDLDLSMSANVGEYTTFSVGIGGSEETSAAGTALSAGTLTYNTIEMTQDFSSLVGNDLTLKLTVGSFNREVTEYETIGLMDHVNGVTDDAFMLTFGVADVTAYAWVSPMSMANDTNKAFIVEAVYSTDMISANVAYNNTGVEKGRIEGGLKVVVADLTAAAMVDVDLDNEVNKVYAGLQYAMAPITAKAAFIAPDVSALDGAGTKVAVGVDYAATDMLTVKVGSTIPLESGKDVGVDGAVCMKVDTVEYKLGVAYEDSTYAAVYDAYDISATNDKNIAVSFQMDVDF